MKFILLSALLLLVSCGNDKTKVINNSARISDLERRMTLNEQLDSMQNQRLDLLEAALLAEQQAREAGDVQLSTNLQAEIDARIAADATLAQLIVDERNARIAGETSLSSQISIEIANRIAGDEANSAALAAAVLNQSLVNFGVQFQIDQINERFVVVNSRLSNLEHRMLQAENDIDSLEVLAAQTQSALSLLSLQLNARVDLLSAQLTATQAQLDREGVKVFKCNSASSTERILKINGKFYAAMNRITKQTVQKVVGSTPYATADICRTHIGEFQMPNPSGNCTPMSGPNAATKIPGSIIQLPTFQNVDLVDSVKVAIDILPDGSYQTTDGAAACVFSISAGGTVSTNLIPVQ